MNPKITCSLIGSSGLHFAFAAFAQAPRVGFEAPSPAIALKQSVVLTNIPGSFK